MCVSFSFTHTHTHLEAAEGNSTVIVQTRGTTGHVLEAGLALRKKKKREGGRRKKKKKKQTRKDSSAASLFTRAAPNGTLQIFPVSRYQSGALVLSTPS